MNHLKSKSVMLFIQLVLVLALCCNTWAQSPASVDPGAVNKSLQPEPGMGTTKLPEIIFQEEKGRHLKGDAGAKFKVQWIRLRGNDAISSEELRWEIDKYFDQTLEVNDLQKIADTITQYYRSKGYILCRAYVPPQTIDLKDGAGKVTVIIHEGRLGRVLIQGNQKYSTQMIRDVMRIITKDGVITANSLERALLLLNDYPLMSVKASFVSSEESGLTNVVLTVKEDSKDWSVGVDYNNYGAEVVGKHRVGTTYYLYNPSGKGDTFKISGKASSDLYYVNLEYSIPVSSDGTMVGASFSNLDYDMAKELAALDADGESKYASLWISHPFMRTRDMSIWGEVAYEYKDLETSYDLAPSWSYSYDLHVARFGGFMELIDQYKGRNLFGLNVYKGLQNGNFKNGRLNVEPDFIMMMLSYRRFQLLPFNFQATVSGTGQYTSDRLPSSEQMHIGGAGTVRGFAQSELSGDKGFYGTVELQYPLWNEGLDWFNKDNVRGAVNLAFFIDYGIVSVNDADTSELAADGSSSPDIAGAGLGLRFAFSPYVEMKVDWAKGISGQRSIDHSNRENGIWYAQFDFKY